MKRLVVLALLAVIVCNCCTCYRVECRNVAEREKTSSRVFIEILPRIELLAGVLSHTSWMKVRGPYGDGNKYFQELREFFLPYRGHRAIEIAQHLTDRGFTHDAPINFMLRLGPLPELEVVHGYGEGLVRQAGSERVLEEFRKALKDLAKTSGFLDFYNSHTAMFNRCINGVASEFDSKKVIRWLENFFGWSGSEYHFILTPAMFPGGGYGINIKEDSGREIMIQVARENGRSVGEPQFLKGRRLEMLSLHEWGHSFVNPTLEKHSHLVSRLEPLYEQVEKTMKKHDYSTVQAFFNEQVVRAVTALAARELYGYFQYIDTVKREEEIGFYLTGYTTEKLQEYIAKRNVYGSFDEFVPYLLEQYYNDMEELLKHKEGKGEKKLALVIFALTALLIFTIVFEKVKGFRRTITWV